MKYVDHYEIEVKRADAAEWGHVGNVYPQYHWAVARPWYLLGLLCHPRMTTCSLLATLEARHDALGAAITVTGGSPSYHYRIWRWDRRGWRLRRTLEYGFEGRMP